MSDSLLDREEEPVVTIARIMVRLLERITIQEQTIAGLRDERTALDSEYQRTSTALAKANDTLRALVEVVNPDIWKDGQANMNELLDQVKQLKELSKRPWLDRHAPPPPKGETHVTKGVNYADEERGEDDR